MEAILRRIYGPEKGKAAFERIQGLLAAFAPAQKQVSDYFSQNQAVLITYGDSLKRSGQAPLQTLRQFATDHLCDGFSAIHILPFFPYSSDDGFSVTDFTAVDPRLGSWDDIGAIAKDFTLMVDLVANHVSAQSDWFQRYLAEQPGFADLAIEAEPSAELASVVRPRALPLLTPFEKASGHTVHVWTTFSADQIDLNYRSLDVLERMVAVLLFYLKKGARIIRLDAIAYLWKTIGTSCIHLPQTHEMVRLFRAILDRIAPETILITETNVPHAQNISYFGDGTDAAQMVYNFTLAPLLLYSLMKGDGRILSQWAETLGLDSPQNSFFNFTASHDGIGLRPLEGILPDAALAEMLQRVRANGGLVSYKADPDGSQSPYELNISYIDALKDPAVLHDPLLAKRFLASQAVALALPGVPAVYIHSLLGTRNWNAGVSQSGQPRRINRQKLDADAVMAQLDAKGRFRARIFHPYLHLLRVRRQQPAFHPKADFEIGHLDRRAFVIQRSSPHQRLYALTNLSGDRLRLCLPERGRLQDRITGTVHDCAEVLLGPYAVLWLS